MNMTADQQPAGKLWIFAQDGLASLVGTTCSRCATVHFPAKPICTTCGSRQVARAELSRNGVVFASTVVHRSFQGFKVPYCVGYVDLSEGVRVVGQLVGTAQPVIGSQAVLDIGPIRETAGRIVEGIRFRIVGSL
jgi:uncharacterized OB-fold protein